MPPAGSALGRVAALVTAPPATALESEYLRVFPTTPLESLPAAIVVALAISVLVGAALHRQVGMPTWRLSLWIAAVVLPTAATWSIPADASAHAQPWETCTLGRVPLPTMIRDGLPLDLWTNILLTIPAGAAAVLWPMGTRRMAALVATLASPIVIEVVQLIPLLHRGCQLGDMLNNMIGVVIGFLLASGVESLPHTWRQVTSNPAGDASRQPAASWPRAWD